MTVVCFGEMLLRLSPAAGATLAETDALSLHVAGAEANVAISLAALGTPARMATVLPDQALGDRALATLHRHGVDTSACLRRSGRMGLFYIESPRAGREGGFFYDRAGSAFACAADSIDWNKALAGAGWLHVSGLTPALGDTAIAALRRAVATARQAGVSISFDCNYRPLLWQGRERLGAELIREFAASARLLFASAADAALLLGTGKDASTTDLLAALPTVEWLATTRRDQRSDGDYLGAMLVHGTQRHDIAPVHIMPFVDRIGAGDAFAAGVLHAINRGWPDAESLRFAHRACVMKHAIAGDFSTLSEAEVRGQTAGQA